MTVYLIRHAQTMGNEEHRYVGRTDEPLTQFGIQNCKSVNAPQTDIIFVSPMQRCLQTAQIIFPNRLVHVVNDLREYDFGDFEYKNYEELKKLSDYHAWIDGKSEGPPNGEMLDRFKERCCRAFETSLHYFTKNINSVSYVIHGGSIMAILERYSEGKKTFYDWQLKNTGIWQGELRFGEKNQPIVYNLKKYRVGG